MTRVTNFGRKRKYLEAGFTTELTTTSNEHPASEVNTTNGGRADSVHPKKKRKRTKEPKTDGGDEQTSGGIETEGETGVKGKGDGPSAGQKKPKIMKRHGRTKSSHRIFSIVVQG